VMPPFQHTTGRFQSSVGCAVLYGQRVSLVEHGHEGVPPQLNRLGLVETHLFLPLRVVPKPVEEVNERLVIVILVTCCHHQNAKLLGAPRVAYYLLARVALLRTR